MNGTNLQAYTLGTSGKVKPLRGIESLNMSERSFSVFCPQASEVRVHEFTMLALDVELVEFTKSQQF